MPGQEHRRHALLHRLLVLAAEVLEPRGGYLESEGGAKGAGEEEGEGGAGGEDRGKSGGGWGRGGEGEGEKVEGEGVTV